MNSEWYFEGWGMAGGMLIIPVRQFPFLVGRDDACALTIASKEISRRHAQIQGDGEGGLLVRDLGSTNGTYVNRQLISAPTRLAAGDIVHFGTSEFRLKWRDLAPSEVGETVVVEDLTYAPLGGVNLPHGFPTREREFLELLDQEMVAPVMQPIVRFSDGQRVGFELLGRGRHPELPIAPLPLFSLAASLDREVDLSEVFRLAGARAASRRQGPLKLFVNSHPREMFSPRLYASLQQFLDIAPQVQLVLEVHETAIVELGKMKQMAERLKDMGVGLAYDDFGAGQARINELAELPPDVVKFDISLIRHIDQASLQKQQVVDSLVSLVRDLGSIPLAEGVETAAEAEVCTHMGFELCQGYFTGRPEPA